MEKRDTDIEWPIERERERETDTEWSREGGERKMVRVEEDGRPDAVSGSAPAEPLSDLV